MPPSSSSTTPTPPPRCSKPPSSSGTGSKRPILQPSCPQHQKPDQFNSIHEKLIAKWKDIDPYLSKPIYFAALDNPEDQLTIAYLRDTAQQAGLETLQMFMQEIGWNDEQQIFVDPDEQPMFSIFKLYPWEAMLQEEFGPHAVDTYQSTRWIEPIWKMLLSNKGILPILWQLYPNHELLLEAHFDGPHNPARTTSASRSCPARARTSPSSATTPPSPPPPAPTMADRSTRPSPPTPSSTSDRHPILGLWMIDQDCCGMGIRESSGPITDNLSSFVPHYFV